MAGIARQVTGIAQYFLYYCGRHQSFNGQLLRRELFDRLQARFNFPHIVETGTLYGMTTAYFAGTGARVDSVEIDPRAHGLSRARFWGRRRVRVHLGNSLDVLPKLLEDSQRRLNPIFFYLDAHWGEHLPLAEEVACVARNCALAVILIDDFAVPGDSGYGFDDYGPDRRLNLAYLEDVMMAYHLSAFFHAASSQQETAAKRGCVVLVNDPGQIAKLSAMPELRAWP